MSVDLFVNGTLMRGLALHANLDGADFLEACQTAEQYRLYSIGDVHPGMFEVTHGGVSVHGELYRVPDDVLERLEAGEPPGLYRGSVALHDGRVVQGILFPRQLAEGIHRDITAYGGWREYIAARDPTMQRPATQPQLGCARPLVETAGPAASGECR
jgi:gamma-glutamylcyclotransferase (GGCT)/AIG2-like uncharacterized protein YtfP